MTEVRLKGRPAAGGFAVGHVVVVSNKQHPVGESTLWRGADDLRAALRDAQAELADLSVKVGGEAAQILGFQLALIEDDALSEPAFTAIEAGMSANSAWVQALQREIDHYQASADEHFRARASDLEDLKDRVLRHLEGRTNEVDFPQGAVLVGDDLSPSAFLSADWSQGGAILLAAGSPTSHVAILARARGIPMITGIGPDVQRLTGDVLVDGEAGEVFGNAASETRRAFEIRKRDAAALASRAQSLSKEPALTRDGERIFVHLNIARVDELVGLDPAICDGIGLVRTEFLFEGQGGMPDEDAQFSYYRQIMQWAAGRPVTIRTLDAGGDKPIRGFTQDGESNPFLGMRGIRLSLIHQDAFRAQLRALIRAAAFGPLKIMLPMVTIPEEVAKARALLNAEIDGFVRQGVAVRRPKLGIMVEVPAVALCLEKFDADFFSIGSNDLTQYATAAGRDIGAVASLANPLHPGVLRLIETIATYGASAGIEVSLCGDAGGDPVVLPHLLKAGLRSVSMPAAVVSRAKATIANVDLGGQRREMAGEPERAARP